MKRLVIVAVIMLVMFVGLNGYSSSRSYSSPSRSYSSPSRSYSASRTSRSYSSPSKVSKSSSTSSSKIVSKQTVSKSSVTKSLNSSKTNGYSKANLANRKSSINQINTGKGFKPSTTSKTMYKGKSYTYVTFNRGGQMYNAYPYTYGGQMYYANYHNTYYDSNLLLYYILLSNGQKREMSKEEWEYAHNIDKPVHNYTWVVALGIIIFFSVILIIFLA